MKSLNHKIALIRSLWLLLGNSVNKDLSLKDVIESWLNFIDRIKTKEGTKQAIAYAKACKVIAVALITNDKFTPIPFRKSNKRGIPVGLKPLLPLLESDNLNDKRIGFTIVMLYKHLHLPPSPDLSTITDRGEPLDEGLVKEFTEYADKWVKSKHIPKVKSGYPWHNPGSKSGPNGHALLTSHYDMVAVIRNPQMLQDQVTIGTLSGTLRRVALYNHVPPYDGAKVPITSKLAQLCEPGGKTRTVAIGDYFSQLTLKPLHDVLMEMLRELETDGTWNQDEQANRVKREACHPCFSFDLSSATDRFPVRLTTPVISSLWGEEVGQAWERLMVDRDFQIRNTKVRYGRGQPMGFYTSWASFALTHHIVIQFLADQKGFKSFKKYAVLGDDVVIWDREVASAYQAFMGKIGVPINLTKSLISEENHTRVEFAQRVFYNGSEISPLGYELLEQVSGKSYLLPILFQELVRRGWELPNGNWDLVPGISSQKGREILFLIMDGLYPNLLPEEALCPAVRPLELKELGVTYTPELRARAQRKLWDLRAKALHERVDRIREDITNLRNILSKFLPEEGSFSEIILESLHSSVPSHPAPFVLKDVEIKVEEIIHKTGLIREFGSLDESVILEVIEYIPTPLEESYQRDKRVMKADESAKLWLKAIFQTLNPEHTEQPKGGIGGQTDSIVDNDETIDFCDAGF